MASGVTEEYINARFNIVDSDSGAATEMLGLGIREKTR
jgi:hypothetical protein